MLLVKPLAILGTTALLLAASVRAARRARVAGAWAGPPTLDEDDEGEHPLAAPSAGRRGAAPRRSALLLAGRLLMAVLLAFLGWMQVQPRARLLQPLLTAVAACTLQCVDQPCKSLPT